MKKLKTKSTALQTFVLCSLVADVSIIEGVTGAAPVQFVPPGVWAVLPAGNRGPIFGTGAAASSLKPGDTTYAGYHLRDDFIRTGTGGEFLTRDHPLWEQAEELELLSWLNCVHTGDD